MNTLTETEIRNITEAMDREFPNDPALQQVHIARKIIALEAEREGMHYISYIKLLARRALEKSRL